MYDTVVEFLSLPPLYFYQWEVKPSIRAARGRRRDITLFDMREVKFKYLNVVRLYLIMKCIVKILDKFTFKKFLSYFLQIGLLLTFLAVLGMQEYFLDSVTLADQHSKSLILTDLMTPEAIRLLIQKAADSWINSDAEAFARLFVSDGEFIAPGHQWVGFESIKQAAKEFHDAHSQVVIKVKYIIIENSKAAVEWTWADVNTITGEHSQANDAIMVDFFNGKILRWREYIDNISSAD